MTILSSNNHPIGPMSNNHEQLWADEINIKVNLFSLDIVSDDVTSPQWKIYVENDTDCVQCITRCSSHSAPCSYSVVFYFAPYSTKLFHTELCHLSESLLKLQINLLRNFTKSFLIGKLKPNEEYFYGKIFTWFNRTYYIWLFYK